MRKALAAFAAFFVLSLWSAAGAAPGQYKNFRTAVYVVVNATKELADPKVFAEQYARAERQLHFDKVYIEVYRNHMFATDAEIEAVKKAFEAKGIIVAGGVTLAAGGKNGQFGTFDYEDQADRDECKRASELAAKHFNEVILDDFFFYTSKSDADIAAKGTRSWTQYRLDTMREAAKNLVIDPAHAVNPAAKVVIKYPNWYDHFQGLGFDLDKEAQMFDGIYAGTETRDPIITDQLLQPYESYEIIRYYSAIRPAGHNGGNGGGWVDTYSIRTVDRYAEQLWDTVFAKAPEITLFNWANLIDPDYPLKAGERQAWEKRPTSFDWNAMVKGYHAAGKDDKPLWGRAAGYALEEVDKVLGSLGNPIGIASYKPYQSDGEDFLQNYLGTYGIPIAMTPVFPDNAKIVLLTQQASDDPGIVAKIERNLKAGGKVVITSGFLRAMQDKGFKNIAEWETTGNVLAVKDFYNGFGAGNGELLNTPRQQPILFPEVRFYTNDSWAIVRGVAGGKADPILLMNNYGSGTIYLLNIPENMSELYAMPQGAVTKIKHYLMDAFPVVLDAPDHVALFAYDNDTLAVENYRDSAAAAKIVVPGRGAKLRDLKTGKLIAALPPPPPPADPRARRWYHAPDESVFPAGMEAHSFATYRIEK